MPELPEMRALAERLGERLVGRTLERVDALSFSALKSAEPPVRDLCGRSLVSSTSTGKYLRLALSGGLTVAVHLGQSGRVLLEEPPGPSRPRDAVVRFSFEGTGVMVRERSREHRAGWWVLAPEDDGPMAKLGPDPFDTAFADLVRSSAARRQLHSWLRDQQVVAGIGRGYADDILHAACLSPFANVGRLDDSERERLLVEVRAVLAAALDRARTATGGLSDADLENRFIVHRRYGQPCPRCGENLQRVSYTSCEVVYCPHCQCNDRVLADRRLSRLLR